MHTEDTYIYQSIPLPVPETLGSQAYDPSQVGVSDAANVPGPGDPTSSPFGDSVATPTGGGGGGTPSFDCTSTASIGTINTSTIKLDCTNKTAEITNTHANLSNTAGTETGSLDATACKVTATNTNGTFQQTYTALTAQVTSDGSDWLNIAYSDFDITKDVQIKLQELDVCHMGAPGLRKFVAGNSYAP